MFFTVSQHISLAFVFQCRIFYPLWKNLYINVNIFCDSLMLTSPNHSLRFFSCWWPFLFYCSWWSILFFFSLSSTMLFRRSFSFLPMSGINTLSSAHLTSFRLRPPLYVFWSNYNILCLISMRNTKKKKNYRYMRIWEKYFFKSKCT